MCLLGSDDCSNSKQQLQDAALRRTLDSLSLASAGQSQAEKRAPKDHYAFWETQPVTQFRDAAGSSEVQSRC